MKKLNNSICNSICYCVFLMILIVCQSADFSLFDNTKTKSSFKSRFNTINKLKSKQSNTINSIPGSNITSLNIEAGKLDEASFRFGCSNEFFSFGYRGKFKDFALSYQQKPIISFNKENQTMVFADILKAESGLIFKGSYKIRNNKQWTLLYDESFSDEIVGWNFNETTECGGVVMLGGYGKLSKTELTKKFENLPIHESIRIQVNYHFIDAWDNESGYIQADIGGQGGFEYLWIDRYSAFIGNNGLNICGGKWPEGKFSTPVDVTFPHKGSTVAFKFGSTIEQDSFDQSFGISSLKLYFR